MRHLPLCLVIVIGCSPAAPEPSSQTVFEMKPVSGFHVTRRSPVDGRWYDDVHCFKSTRTVFVSTVTSKHRRGEVRFTYDDGMEMVAYIYEEERLKLYAPEEPCKVE